MGSYIRDKRSPTPKNSKVSRVMSANKAKNTKPEITLRKELFNTGLKGYRVHYKDVPGKPDICYTSKKLAIFVNGCYWHRCPHCNLSLPKHNQVFWEQKFSKNVERDLRKAQQLKDLGWRVLIVWECQIKKDIKNIVDKIHNFLH